MCPQRIGSYKVASVKSFGIVLLAMHCSSVGMAQQGASVRSPDEVIAYLASLRHGLVERVMDDETKDLLHHVVNNPTVYVKAIAEAMGFRSEEPLTDHRYRRIGTGLGLAKKTGRSDLFSQSVVHFFEQITKRLQHLRVTVKPMSAIENKELRREYQHVLSLRNSGLDILSAFADSSAIDICLEGLIEEREYMSGGHVVMLRYLEKVALLRLDIRPKLEEMYNSPTSPLRNHPQLLRVLEAIDKAEAEKKRDRDGKDGEQETTPDP